MGACSTRFWLSNLFAQSDAVCVTKILPADSDSIRRAAEILRGGGLVAFPTETVYGLGADAQNEAAVRAMFAAKGRPPDHPVIVHLPDVALIEKHAIDISPAARQLAAAFWPGPMTLVVRRGPEISNLVTGGLDTVGLRVPSHPVAQALLREFGGLIAAPSANRFGRVSCTTAEHVSQELGERVDLILDGGECLVGLESTIIDVSGPQPAILRPGAVTAEQVSAVLGFEVTRLSSGSPRVSGSLPSHYAPRAMVEIVPADQLGSRARQLATEGKKVAVLSSVPATFEHPSIMVLPIPADISKLAHELYSLLRRVDELGCDVALVTVPAEQGLGTAIADRLRRAAGPRQTGA
jgi:L-threonylcarbamoyladenylate synthase